MSQIDKDLNDALSGMIRGIGRLFTWQEGGPED